ncbi:MULTISPECIES: transposase [Rhizobium]|uniref:transposase n=1 Tax=Rhizobium TaxID=379 RepID=UPI0013F176E5|nr:MULTISPECIES: transposase [Rhizobium]KAF5888093.1 hypothetical protein FY112_00945 [Rhizobium sp. PEPV16]MBY5778846.1 transposase [Rhizobium leguminosarum]MBY5787472.1 transposase [Rhizobium leguminosarum]
MQADKIVGASDAFLEIDGTGLPKKGDYSIGISRQWISSGLVIVVRVPVLQRSH